jgi:hypothetical protein
VNFSNSFLEDAPNAAPEERAAVSDLKLFIGDQNICLHMEGKELYDHVVIAVYGLAIGLVHDWWRIFGSRDKDFRLIRHRMGYAVPDVRFRFDGVAFEVSANQCFYKNPDVRFFGAEPELTTRPRAEHSLAGFVEEVIFQLRNSGVLRTSAELRWDRVRASREDPDEAAFCEAAGALDVDPYNLTNQTRAFIEQSGRVFSGEPLIEFLAGISDGNLRQATLEWVDEADARPDHKSRLPELRSLAQQVSRQAPPRAGDRSWALGYRRARAARAALNMGESTRIKSVFKLAETLGNKTFRRASKINGLRALVSTRNSNIHVHLRDRPPTEEARVSELFSFTRAIGDAICFPETARSVMNGLHDADRQAAGRAFAAQFLAPLEAILSMREDASDVTSIADELNVSTEVVERQIQNQKRIQSALT